MISVYERGASKSYRFSDLYDRAAACSRKLIENLAPGLRIAVIAANDIETVLLDLACIHAGICSVFMDDVPAWTGSHDQHLARLNVGLLIAPDKYRDLLRGQTAVRVLFLNEVFENTQGPMVKAHEWADSAFLTIKQTSGSTASPKSVGTMVSSVDDTISSVQALMQHRPDDKVLIFLPLSLLQQRTWIYAAIYYGFDIVLCNFVTVWKAAKETRPTVIMGVPKLYSTAKEKIELEMTLQGGKQPENDCQSRERRRATAEKIFGDRIRYLWTGSAPCPSEVLSFFEECGIPLLEGYGTNESDIISKNTPRSRKLGTVGTVLPNRVVSLDADGQIIVTKVFPVTSRYESSDGAPGGFRSRDTYATGDLGSFDSDGFLTITGRLNDLIVLQNGATVNPVEIEQMIESDKRVRYAVVFVGQDGNLQAALDIHGDANPERGAAEIVRACNERLHASKRIVRHVVAQPFTVENDCLSQQFKIRRKVIATLYANS